MKKQDPTFEWKTPINFYGKVIDQNNEPVAGVAIKFVWNDISPKGSSYAETTSDAGGLFSLIDKEGKGVSVSVSKKGYHIGNAASGSFEYAAFFEWNYHEPDENSPVIFRLVKKVDAEPLVVGSAFNTLSYEQGTYYYDLQRGVLSRESPVGDGLKFTITRSQAAQGQPFDWTWTVDGVNAMVRATTDEFPQSAPTEAYSFILENRAKGQCRKLPAGGESPPLRSHERRSLRGCEFATVPSQQAGNRAHLEREIIPQSQRFAEPRIRSCQDGHGRELNDAPDVPFPAFCGDCIVPGPTTIGFRAVEG